LPKSLCFVKAEKYLTANCSFCSFCSPSFRQVSRGNIRKVAKKTPEKRQTGCRLSIKERHVMQSISVLLSKAKGVVGIGGGRAGVSALSSRVGSGELEESV
jgi:hypothetical protein